ncbi:glycosyltransferase [Arthrobacter rhombi]|uniref:glycosyltransferase n=1 Tax=Arthrobacter rhombi TaxID=71253 RepID=UPI000B35AF13|nr:glycosyltransferase [Arthrobacter rhombi]
MKSADWIVVLAGSRWDDTRGTDHRMAEALSKKVRVLWVDPPVPIIGSASGGHPAVIPGYSVDPIQAGLVRLRVAVPPAFTKPLMRNIASALVHRAIRSVTRSQKTAPLATVLLSPRDVFPRNNTGHRVLHVTDDWPAGAQMMGLTRAQVVRTLRQNIQRADSVTVVTPYLVGNLPRTRERVTPVVLPNGCGVPEPTLENTREHSASGIGLIGQLNERLDMDLLDELAASGLPIEVIGPRRERQSETVERLDRFLHAENVTWMGEMSEDALRIRLQKLAVGITPYADNEFNRASFPLKTMDYLAAGLAVVSTDLPAVHWLNSSLISVGSTHRDFVDQVACAHATPADFQTRNERRSFARRHTWDARAEQLLGLIRAEKEIT